MTREPQKAIYLTSHRQTQEKATKTPINRRRPFGFFLGIHVLFGGMFDTIPTTEKSASIFRLSESSHE